MSFKTTLVATAVCALCSPAWADNVDFTGYAHGSQAVHYTLATPNVAKVGDANAGGFLTSINGGPSFTSYCIDLYETINFADPAYPGYTQNNAHVFTNAAAYGNLGKLFAHYASIVDTAAEEAAFQIAVWEIAYENSGAPYAVGSGAASFTGTGTTLSLAQGWLDDLGSNVLSPTIYESGVAGQPGSGHQDIIFAPVPEPSTVMLMVAGMLGLGTMARRRAAWNADRG